MTWPLAEELVEVLRRPRLAAYGIDEAAVQAVLAFLEPALPSVDVDVVLRDPEDGIVVAAAVAAEADAIVTGDADLLDAPDLLEWLHDRGIEVLTRADVVAVLG